jgi:hypothetical protein
MTRVGEIPSIIGRRQMSTNDVNKYGKPSVDKWQKVLVQLCHRSDACKLSAIQPPSLYAFNARSIAKPHAIEQLTADLIGYDIDVAVKKHSESCVAIQYNIQYNIKV